MSGVIDENGVQWEHCNNCHGWVRIQDLRYEPKSDEHPYGRDLCGKCATAAAKKPDKLLQIQFDPDTGTATSRLVDVDELP